MDAVADVAYLEQALAAHGRARAGTAGDAIVGVIPTWVMTPSSAGGVAACLALANARGVRTVLRGAGTKLGWGRVPGPVDLVLDLRGLNRVIEHQHGDLTATIEGGASIGDVNRELSRHRQWLPFDSALESATIGGLVATNDSGPLRLRYGTPRDQLIGVTLAMADGRLVKAGGRVVKNVAGYDLGRLVSGSHGTFAAIVSATFKLAPIPRCLKTVIVECGDQAALVGALERIRASPAEPIALELHVSNTTAPGSDRWRLFTRFGSTPGAVDAEIDALDPVLGAGAGAMSIVADDADRAFWAERSSAVWANPGTILRAAWLPAATAAVLDLLRDISTGEQLDVEIVARAPLGAGLIRVSGQPMAEVRAIGRLRDVAGPVKHVTLLRGNATVRDHVDVWEPLGTRESPLKALKQAFDPKGILNAGRGPV